MILEIELTAKENGRVEIDVPENYTHHDLVEAVREAEANGNAMFFDREVYAPGIATIKGITEKKTIIMEWSSEDVKSIAECAGIELSDQDVNKICEDLIKKFNNSDYLNDYISECIAEAVKKYER